MPKCAATEAAASSCRHTAGLQRLCAEPEAECRISNPRGHLGGTLPRAVSAEPVVASREEQGQEVASPARGLVHPAPR